MICNYCGIETINIGGSHSKKCIEYIKIKDKLTKEYLTELYINQKISIIDITKMLDLKNHDVIHRLLKKYQIPIRSFSDACKNGSKKRKQTNLERTGFEHNFCKNSYSRQKWEKRLLEEEGITNVFQREEVKQKSAETFIKKYKMENPTQLSMSRGKNTYSKIHRQIVQICQDNNIDVLIEYKIKKPRGQYYSYDIIIKDTKKIIEVYGDYWHANPKIYKETDLILKGSSREMTAQYKWNFDKDKNNFAISEGYQILIIWEYDIKNNLETIISNILTYSQS